MKRFPAFVLAILIIANICACSSETEPTETSAGTSNGETTTGDETTVEEYTLDLPEANFDGQTITYLTCDGYSEHFKLNIDEQDGDTLNDAGYQRELAVGDLLNVEFDAVEVDTGEVASSLSASVMAGSGDYDFVLPHATTGISAMVTSGSLLDWNTLEYVDFTKPWWNSTMQESLGIAGKVFYASGDIVMTWQGMGCYLFNKDYLENYNIDTNMYDLVYEGKWTVDKLLELIKGVSQDLNGDSQMTEVDQYGLLANKGQTVWFQFGCGQHISKLDENNCPVLDMGGERMASVVEKYYNVLYSDDTYLNSFSSYDYATGTYRDMLISGRSFLTIYDIGGLYSYLREIEFDFGILPDPKLDEAQEDYYSFCGAGLIGIPVDTENPERTAMVAEALAYYSYEYVRPAFFDVVLQNKAVRDEDSYNMLTMMHENKVFDFGFNFDGTASGALNSVVVGRKSTDFASYYASIEDRVNETFRQIYETVSNQ